VPSSRSRTRSRYRIAVVLLSLMTAGLAAALVSCPQKKPAAAPGAVRPSPAPEPAPAEPQPSVGETPTPAQVTEPVRPSVMPVEPAERGELAFIIDDAGYDLDDLQPFLDLAMPLAVAVLPNLPHSAEAARRVHGAGKELLLHLPMEPEGGENPGPGALLTGQPAAEIERLLDEALASVPGAIGVNNHMGSKATADRAFMDDLLDALDRRGLFFVDSRTTALTVAAPEAERLGVPYLARKVFLDAVDGGIEKSLEGAIDAAARGGSAVAIGHVQTDGLADILRRAADGMRRSGVKPATLSELIGGRGGKAAE
jgi:polysaccharide deacetylase 2 family uncharacterized protein YibQ